MARKYELKSRAERQQETRQRIVAATVELHEELGPARTSISAIAERAGVERLTVYRHFATEGEIFQACSAHFRTLHPLPDLTAWEAIADPWARLERGLTDLYHYFAETERMTSAVLRDAPTTPAMDKPVARFQNAFAEMVGLLAASFTSAWARLAICLAVDFRTWQIMVREQGMDVSDAVAYQLQIVRCAADRT